MKHTNKNINLICFKKTLLKITVVDTFKELYQQISEFRFSALVFQVDMKNGVLVWCQ
jgi:hypothetical protein